jgi:hypothetical protein
MEATAYVYCPHHVSSRNQTSHLWCCAQVMFSGPLPELSCRLNAWATALTCQWLMGPCKVNDVEQPDGTVGDCCCYVHMLSVSSGYLLQQWRLCSLTSCLLVVCMLQSYD